MDFWSGLPIVRQAVAGDALVSLALRAVSAAKKDWNVGRLQHVCAQRKVDADRLVNTARPAERKTTVAGVMGQSRRRRLRKAFDSMNGVYSSKFSFTCVDKASTLKKRRMLPFGRVVTRHIRQSALRCEMQTVSLKICYVATQSNFRYLPARRSGL